MSMVGRGGKVLEDFGNPKSMDGAIREKIAARYGGDFV